MNILFLEAVQAHGGARKSTVELADRLKKNNHNVTIADFWGNCLEFVEDVRSHNINLEILLKQTKPIIIKTSNNPIEITLNVLNFLKQQKILKKNLNRIIKDRNIEIVIVNNSKTLSILNNNESYKVVYFARGWFNLNSIPLLKRYFFKKKTDYFIGVSQSTRQSIFSGGFAPLQNIFVLPNAIDLDKIEKYKLSNPVTKSDNKFRILHCGGFLKEKGQLLTIELAKKLVKNKINFEILILGAIYDGPESKIFYDSIVSTILYENLGDYIKIVTNSKEPYKYFNESDIVIHPSYTEGLPRVIMEAMAFKKPVIANAVGGVTDFVLHEFTGYITDFNNVDDYYKYVLKLYNDTIEYDRISENGYQLIKSNYKPQKQVDNFESILNKMLN